MVNNTWFCQSPFSQRLTPTTNSGERSEFGVPSTAPSRQGSCPGQDTGNWETVRALSPAPCPFPFNEGSGYDLELLTSMNGKVTNFAHPAETVEDASQSHVNPLVAPQNAGF